MTLEEIALDLDDHLRYDIQFYVSADSCIHALNLQDDIADLRQLAARMAALERVAAAARLHSSPGVHGRCGICVELSALDALAQTGYARPAQEATP